MFQKLVSHNSDLRRLVEKGYAVAFDNNNCLIVRDIPYLDAGRKLQIGALVAKLTFVDDAQVIQDDHQVYFAGGVPHELDGTAITNLGGGPTQLALSPDNADIVVQRSFSNKPRIAGKFADFFDKIESYVGIISAPATELYGTTPLTFRAVTATLANDTPFKFHDTLSSRAEITDLSARLKRETVAVIGLGGTGAYVLDFLVKTPVHEIRAFDPDDFYVHNAYRSPGKLDPAELGRPKADVYRERYKSFRDNLKVEQKFIDSSCADDFQGVTFAFICVDKGTSRQDIVDLLIARKIPFIDVGMGLNRKRDALNGMLRTTYFPADAGAQVRGKGLIPLTDDVNDEYRRNVQIAELNALNACFAVIKFKQICGFYLEQGTDFHYLFEVADLKHVLLAKCLGGTNDQEENRNVYHCSIDHNRSVNVPRVICRGGSHECKM